MSESYLIGVDTGGTYTDAVVIETADNRVLARAKALTTRGNLAIGVSEAIRGALSALPEAFKTAQIGLVSVSTTLATNAVVEGQGSAVGVVLIGFDEPMVQRTGIAAAFPGMPVIRVPGGHDHNGGAVEALDLSEIEAKVTQAADKVDAFAVASRFAVRNNEHEEAARQTIVKLTGKPVTLSSELSSALDAPRRALTAVLNARLIWRISMLIAAVREAMAGFGIEAPLMMVKGDGTLALAETVEMRPIETVLSGPAASLVGAATLSGLKDFILSDMGGTTTDIGFLSDGRPIVSETGAEVGGWRTMVKAIDARTIGLGGDSEVVIDHAGKMKLGPRRVVPLSLLASRFGEIKIQLEAQLADRSSSSMGRFALFPLGASKPQLGTGVLNDREAALMEIMSDRPQAVARIAPSSALQGTINALQRKGLIQICGFTPSDAAHVLDMQDNWSRDAAALGARIVARQRNEASGNEAGADELCRDVWDEAVTMSGRAVLAAVLGSDGKVANDGIVDAVCRGKGRLGRARVSISPDVPVVAVGGPVKVYYPEVGNRLGAEVVFSEFCDVANAVGAASGVIARVVCLEVSGDGGGIFQVLDPHGAETFRNARKAIDRACERASELARSAVLEMGALDPELRVNVEKQMLPDAVDDNGLLAAQVRVEAVGRPQF